MQYWPEIIKHSLAQLLRNPLICGKYASPIMTYRGNTCGQIFLLFPLSTKYNCIKLSLLTCRHVTLW